MDIVIATDGNYVIHSLVLLESICYNNKSDICFHVFGFNLKNDDKSLLKRMEFKYDNICFLFYDINETFLRKSLFRECLVSQDRSLATYARLLIPNLLPKTIDRCLYLDVDAIVLDSLLPLFEINMEGYAIAGVLDTNPLSRHIAVGLGKEDSYINAGMILWNLSYCRNINVCKQFEDFIFSRNGSVDAMDQGTLNGVLSKYTLILSPQYNVLTSFFQMTSEQIKRLYHCRTYEDLQIQKAVSNPVFIHFTPNFTTRPWCENSLHPLRDKYRFFRERVAGSFSLDRDKRSFKLKCLSFLFYNLPFDIFLSIISLYRKR